MFTVIRCWMLTISIAAAELNIDSIYYSAHHYAGSANQSGTASLANRLVETPYDGVSVQ